MNGIYGQDELKAFKRDLKQSRKKARRVKCINNLKRIGLASNIYEDDHGGQLPDSLRALKRPLGRELSVLVGPSDDERNVSDSWEEFQPSQHTSYRFNSGPEIEPSQPGEVLAECRIHGYVVLVDGSAHRKLKEYK